MAKRLSQPKQPGWLHISSSSRSTAIASGSLWLHFTPYSLIQHLKGTEEHLTGCHDSSSPMALEVDSCLRSSRSPQSTKSFSLSSCSRSGLLRRLQEFYYLAGYSEVWIFSGQNLLIGVKTQQISGVTLSDEDLHKFSGLLF